MPSILKTIAIVAVLIVAYEAAAFYIGYDVSIYSIYSKTQQTEADAYIKEARYFGNQTLIPKSPTYIVNLDSSTSSVIIQFTVIIDAPVKIASGKYSFTVGHVSFGSFGDPIQNVELTISHTWTNSYSFTAEYNQDQFPVFAGTYGAGFAVRLYTPESYLLMEDFYSISVVSS